MYFTFFYSTLKDPQSAVTQPLIWWLDGEYIWGSWVTLVRFKLISFPSQAEPKEIVDWQNLNSDTSVMARTYEYKCICTVLHLTPLFPFPE